MNFSRLPTGIDSGLHCSAEISLGVTRDGGGSRKPNLSHGLCKVKWHGHDGSSGSAPIQIPRTDVSAVAAAAGGAGSHWKFTRIPSLTC